MIFGFSSINATLIDDQTAYYTFDGNALDSTPNNYDGVVSSATQTTGKINTSYLYDGNDKISVPNLLDTYGDEVSFSFWFNPTVTYSTGAPLDLALFSKNNIDLTDRILGSLDNADGHFIFFYEANDGGAVVIDSTTNTWTGGIWYHLVITWDDLGNIKLYVNDNLETTSSGNNVMIGSGDSEDFTIGIRYGDVNGFEGKIDEFGVWNRALLSTEITELYNGDSGLQYPYGTPVSPNLAFTNITANNITLINNTFYNDSINFETTILNTSTNGNVNQSYTLYNFIDNKKQLTQNNISNFFVNLNSLDEYCTQQGLSSSSENFASTGTTTTAFWNGSVWLPLTLSTGSTSFGCINDTQQYATNNLNGSFNLNLSDYTYLINFFGENNENNVTSDNFAFIVDTTPPTIEVLQNLTTDNYFINFSNAINVTDNLSGLNSCTINITYLSSVQPDSNFLINCTDTQLFTRAGFYEGFVRAEDNAGNVNTLSANGTINPVINIFFNDTIGKVFNYTAKIYHPDGDTSNLVSNVNGSIQLSPVNEGELDLGIHIIQFQKFGYNTQNYSQIVNTTNAGTNVTFIVIPVTLSIQVFDSVSTTTQLTFNVTIQNGTDNQVFLNQLNFEKQYNETLSGDINLIIESSGYSTGYFFNTLEEDTSISIDAYLTQSNISQTIKFFVAQQSQASVGLSGVLIELQKLINGSFVTIQQAFTGATGESFIQTDASQSYLFVFSKDGFVSATAQSIPEVLEYAVSLSSTAETFSYIDDISFSFTPIATVLDTNYTETFTGFISGTGFTSITFNVYDQNNTLLYTATSTNPTGTTFSTDIFLDNVTSLIKSEIIYIVDGVSKIVSQEYEIKQVDGFIKTSKNYAENSDFTSKFFRFIVIMILIVSSLAISQGDNLQEISLFVIPAFAFLSYIDFIAWYQAAALSVLAIVFYIGGKK